MPRPLSVLVLLLPAIALGAQREGPAPVVLPGETREFITRLQLADTLASEGKWADAIQEYQRLLREAPNALVPAALQAMALQDSVQLRQLCHLRLGALPEQALRQYRRRADPAATRLLKEGLAERDAALLRRVADEAFCSTAGEAALDALGELAFERGQFAEAGRWWRRLTPPASEGPAALYGAFHYPDPRGDMARVRAKQILALVFQGDLAAAAAELAAFRKRHAAAAGRLGGREGNYAAIIAEWLRRPPDFPHTQDWPTFAGNPERNRALPTVLPRGLWVDGPTWRTRLDKPEGPLLAGQPAGPSAERSRGLAFHPVIAGGQILLAGPAQVLAFDLWSGQPLYRYDVPPSPSGRGARREGRAPKNGGGPVLPVPAPADAPWWLTTAGGRAYACLGPAQYGTRFLVCLDLDPGARPERRQRWRVEAADKPGTVAFFGCPPVVKPGHVYVVVHRPAGDRLRTFLACHDAVTGALRWQQQVFQGPVNGATGGSLTLAGDHLIYCSHAGLVVAVDAHGGSLAWGVRYPPRANTADGDPSPRAPVPALYADNRLFVAPADADRLFCLDPDTGRTLWDRDGIEVVHLLGCAAGRILFTTPRGIRAVAARTGTDQDGWVQPAEGRLSGYGRGLLADGWVFWPVQDRLLPLRALNVEDGTQQRGDTIFTPADLRRIRAGNLAWGSGCLVVADVDELVGYVPPEHFLKKRLSEAGARGAEPARLYRLALAEAGAGLGDVALKHLQQAEADPSVRPMARAQRHYLLLNLHAPVGASAAYLNQAAWGDFSPALRLEALQRLAALHRRADAPRKEVEAWQTLLREDRLRRALLPGGPSAAALAYARIGELVKEHGDHIYEALEKEAAAALAGSEPLAGCLRAAAIFPNARATRAAIGRLARQPPPRQDADLAQVFRTFLEVADRLPLDRRDDSANCVEAALRGLARAYERQRCWEAARATWQRLATTFDDPGARRRLQASDYLRLAREERLRSTGESFSLPLRRTWQARAGQTLTPACGPLARQLPEELFSIRGRELTCHDAGDGRARWTAAVPVAPIWLGCQADLVLVAGPAGIQARRLADGRPVWSWPVDGIGLQPELTGFCLTADRLLFLSDRRELMALRPETGMPLWSRFAPSALLFPEGGGRYQPGFYADRDWVLVQTTGGHRLTVRSPTGALVHDHPTAAEPWPQPPVPLGAGRYCLVESAWRILLFDAASGNEVWSWKARLPTTRTGQPPRLFAGAGALVLQIPRNYGYDLERLGPTTGAPLWTEGARLLPEAVAPESVVLDLQAIYLATDRFLYARSLEDGKLLWRQPLGTSAAHWQLMRAGPFLLAWPRQVDWPVHWSWLAQGANALAVPLRARLGRAFPLRVCDLRSGRLLQRLDFQTPFPGGTVLPCAGGLAVGVWGTAQGLKGP